MSLTKTGPAIAEPVFLYMLISLCLFDNHCSNVLHGYLAVGRVDILKCEILYRALWQTLGAKHGWAVVNGDVAEGDVAEGRCEAVDLSLWQSLA